MIGKFEPFMGPIFYRLINALEAEKYSLVIKQGLSKYSYILRNKKSKGMSEAVAIFIKYASKPRSPWRYTVTDEDQEEIKLLQEECKTVFVLMINGLKDGIACVEYNYLKEILDENFEPVEWISVSRRLGTEYQIKGKDGKLKRKIPRNLFPKAVIDKMVNFS